MNDIELSYHVSNVYAIICWFLASYAFGSYVYVYSIMNYSQVFTVRLSFLALVVYVCSLFAFLYSKTETAKFNYGMISGGSFGVTGGYLIERANYLDLTIVPLGVTVTVGIFLAMTLITKYITDQQMAWLGSFIGSILSGMLMFSLFSIFVTVPDIVYDIRLFLGLVVFCWCISFDTHKMREKFRAHFSGPIDYYEYAMNLFIVIVTIFRKVVTLLIRNSEKNAGGKKKNNCIF